MLAGDEVVCAVGDPAADADVARTAATLADALEKPLVLVRAIDGARPASLVRSGPAVSPPVGAPPEATVREGLAVLAAELGPAVDVRLFEGPIGAVLRGLGRALATALLVVGGDDATRAQLPQLLATWGCPLVVAPRDGPPLRRRRVRSIACLVGDDGHAERSTGLAVVLADALRVQVNLLHSGPRDPADVDTVEMLERCWALAGAHGVPVATTLGVGQWSRSMAATSRSTGADIIVVSAGPSPVAPDGPVPAAAIPELISHAQEVVVIGRPPAGRAR